MTDHLLARSWSDARSQTAVECVSCEVQVTRSPRDFFAVDETASYVVRMCASDGKCAVTLTYAPSRSPSVAAYEETLR